MVPVLLNTLRDKILDNPTTITRQAQTEPNQLATRSHKVSSFIPSLPSGKRDGAWSLRKKSEAFNIDLYPEEPQKGAWLTEGDGVEVYVTNSDNTICKYNKNSFTIL